MEPKKYQEKGAKKDPIALKAKKVKAVVESRTSSKDEQNNSETCLLQRLQDLFQIQEG